MKNKKIDLHNIAGGWSVKGIANGAADKFKKGISRLAKSEFGQHISQKGQDILNKLLQKLESGIEKGINKKVGQAEQKIDSYFN